MDNDILDRQNKSFEAGLSGDTAEKVQPEGATLDSASPTNGETRTNKQARASQGVASNLVRLSSPTMRQQVFQGFSNSNSRRSSLARSYSQLQRTPELNPASETKTFPDAGTTGETDQAASTFAEFDPARMGERLGNGNFKVGHKYQTDSGEGAIVFGKTHDNLPMEELQKEQARLHELREAGYKTVDLNVGFLNGPNGRQVAGLSTPFLHLFNRSDNYRDPAKLAKTMGPNLQAALQNLLEMRDHFSTSLKVCQDWQGGWTVGEDGFALPQFHVADPSTIYDLSKLDATRRRMALNRTTLIFNQELIQPMEDALSYAQSVGWPTSRQSQEGTPDQAEEKPTVPELTTTPAAPATEPTQPRQPVEHSEPAHQSSRNTAEKGTSNIDSVRHYPDVINSLSNHSQKAEDGSPNHDHTKSQEFSQTDPAEILDLHHSLFGLAESEATPVAEIQHSNQSEEIETKHAVEISPAIQPKTVTDETQPVAKHEQLPEPARGEPGQTNSNRRMGLGFFPVLTDLQHFSTGEQSAHLGSRPLGNGQDKLRFGEARGSLSEQTRLLANGTAIPSLDGQLGVEGTLGLAEYHHTDTSYNHTKLGDLTSDTELNVGLGAQGNANAYGNLGPYGSGAGALATGGVGLYADGQRNDNLQFGKGNALNNNFRGNVVVGLVGGVSQDTHGSEVGGGLGVAVNASDSLQARWHGHALGEVGGWVSGVVGEIPMVKGGAYAQVNAREVAAAGRELLNEKKSQLHHLATATRHKIKQSWQDTVHQTHQLISGVKKKAKGVYQQARHRVQKARQQGTKLYQSGQHLYHQAKAYLHNQAQQFNHAVKQTYHNAVNYLHNQTKRLTNYVGRVYKKASDYVNTQRQRLTNYVDHQASQLHSAYDTAQKKLHQGLHTLKGWLGF